MNGLKLLEFSPDDYLRGTTVLHADRIIVLSNNGVAGQGTHKQLMAAGGYYFKLHKAQASL